MRYFKEKLQAMRRRNRRIPHGLLVTLSMVTACILLMTVLLLPVSARMPRLDPRDGAATDQDGIIDGSGENLPEMVESAMDGSGSMSGTDAPDAATTVPRGTGTNAVEGAVSTAEAMAEDAMGNAGGWLVGLLIFGIVIVIAVVIIWWATGRKKD